MKRRKLTLIELGLIAVPLLAFILISAQDRMRFLWSSWFWGGTPLAGSLYDAEFSPDSQTLAVCSWDYKARQGRLDLVDVPSQRLRTSLNLRGAGNLVWSPNGKRLALFTTAGCAVWDIATDAWLVRHRAVAGSSEVVAGWQSRDVLRLRIATLAGPRSKPVWREAHLNVLSGVLQPAAVIAYSTAEEIPLNTSPDGRWKVSISDTRYISTPVANRGGWLSSSRTEGARLQLWDRTTGHLIRTFEGDMFQQAIFRSKTTIAAYAQIASSSGMSSSLPNTAVCTVNIQNLHPQWQMLEAGERAMKFSSGGRFLLTHVENRARLRDTLDWSISEEISYRGRGISQAMFSPDGQYLAYACYSPNVIRIAALSSVDAPEPKPSTRARLKN
ncbi:MAG TPA: hypothetical protein VF600_08310 [Abditibacteriaceae bacterium]|jgi:WD40 repeat protein